MAHPVQGGASPMPRLRPCKVNAKPSPSPRYSYRVFGLRLWLRPSLTKRWGRAESLTVAPLSCKGYTSDLGIPIARGTPLSARSVPHTLALLLQGGLPQDLAYLLQGGTLNVGNAKYCSIAKFLRSFRSREVRRRVRSAGVTVIVTATLDQLNP